MEIDIWIIQKCATEDSLMDFCMKLCGAKQNNNTVYYEFNLVKMKVSVTTYKEMKSAEETNDKLNWQIMD